MKGHMLSRPKKRKTVYAVMFVRLGHCDSGTLVVPELERLLRENGLQSLKANQVGWNRDEAKKLLAEAINRLGVFNCLQWLEGT